jgi:hypothetical protein
MKRLIAFATTASLFALAACDSEDVENTVVDDVDELVDTDAEFDPTARDYKLDDEAQARRDAFDENSFNDEYAGYRDDVAKEKDTEDSWASEREAEQRAASSSASTDRSAETRTAGNSTNTGKTGSGGDSASASGSSSADTLPARDPKTNMRMRGSMTFSYLDRNDDGKLSVAEYAVWAIPVDPNEPKPNDAIKPYVTPDQANKAADSFFYYDRDGDTYLDRTEFMRARLGEDLDPSERA